MTPMLFTALVVVTFVAPPAPPAPADETKPQMASLDGSWTVLCYEKDGQPVAEAKRMTVTVKDNVATFTDGAADEKDSKQKAMKFAFGLQGTIRVSEIEGTASAATDPSSDKKAASGIYGMTKDYLAICLHDEASTGKRGDDSKETPVKDERAGQPNAKSKCTVILQRATAAAPR